MASEGPQNREPDHTRVVGVTAKVLGLVVFVAGIGLMLLAFYWGYQMLRGVDQQLAEVRTAAPVPNPAATSASPSLGSGQKPAAEPGSKAGPSPAASSPVAQAAPQPSGPTLAVVLSSLVVKLVLVLILAAIGGMMAGRGAQMAGLRTG